MALQDYFNEKYDGVDTDPTYHCDFILSADDSSIGEIAESLSNFENLWGQGIKEPLVAIADVLIGPSKLVLYNRKNPPTLMIRLPNNAECIKFGSSKEEFDSLCLPYDETEQYYKATVVGKVQMNEFRGERNPQILITDYEVHGVGYDF